MGAMRGSSFCLFGVSRLLRRAFPQKKKDPTALASCEDLPTLDLNVLRFT